MQSDDSVLSTDNDTTKSEGGMRTTSAKVNVKSKTPAKGISTNVTI